MSKDMEKFQHIRAYIAAASDYVKHPTEQTASLIDRNLGVNIKQ